MVTAAPPSPVQFSDAISTVAAAQICFSIGFRCAEPYALRLLSDLIGRYLCSLAGTASDRANSEGRTDSNLFDIVRALELLHRPRGFSGAGCPVKPLLRSAILRDISQFVSSVDEIPFAMPLPRAPGGGSLKRKSTASFAESAAHPAGPHVPRWLPMFPARNDGCGVVKTRRELLWPEKGREMRCSHGSARTELRSGGVLPKNRERLVFRIGDVRDRGGRERGEKSSSGLDAARKLAGCDGRVCVPMALPVASGFFD